MSIIKLYKPWITSDYWALLHFSVTGTVLLLLVGRSCWRWAGWFMSRCKAALRVLRGSFAASWCRCERFPPIGCSQPSVCSSSPSCSALAAGRTDIGALLWAAAGGVQCMIIASFYWYGVFIFLYLLLTLYVIFSCTSRSRRYGQIDAFVLCQL